MKKQAEQASTYWQQDSMQKETHPELPNWLSERRSEHSADIQEEHGPCVCSKSSIFHCIEWQHVHISDNCNTALWSYLCSAGGNVQHRPQLVDRWKLLVEK
eukprot:TRINITY_DN7552_c0_g2_i9.p2 TRINITY_DN7552_c0_g2~~TRINITY_DN7552_c0_g2_i9.p2  ORF type:complete len:101 (+),score=18.04 TRINITY_DN7552_c0_g2_i9:651-953(+)